MSRVFGAAAVKARLDAIRGVVPKALSRERLGAFLVRRMQERITKGVDPDGKPWAPLSPRTLETKKGPGILRETGHLQKAVGVVSGAAGGRFAISSGAGFRIGINSVKYVERSKDSSREVDTAVYGRAHQLGHGRVPQRRIVGIGQADVKAVSDLIRRELRKAAG